MVRTGVSVYLQGGGFFARIANASAGVNLTDCLCQILGGRTLEHVGLCSFGERPSRLGIRIKSSQDDNAGFRKLFSNGYHGINAAHIREPQVHEGDIGLVFTKAFDCLLPAGRLCHHSHPRLGIDHHGNPFAKERMIIDTEHANLGIHRRVF